MNILMLNKVHKHSEKLSYANFKKKSLIIYVIVQHPSVVLIGNFSAS